MHVCDVLIVGGGPAGSSCARRLTRAGMQVLLLDKAAFPRDKPCAGWITPQVVAELALDVDQYRRGRVWQPIHGFRCGVIGGPEATVHYGRPISYGIRRCEFDTYLLERCGAERRTEPVTDLQRRGGSWVVNGRHQAPLLVGAGGHFCPVARRLGARRQAAASVILAQEVEFAATPDQLRGGSVRADVPELFFCPDLTGYGWCVRKGGFLNIGLGRLDSGQLSGHIQRFCDFLREQSKLAGEIRGRFKGHAYQLYERVPTKLIDDGVLLVGDAAGLAYPQSGEGIRPAVESGLLAADAVLAADGSFTEDDLRPYQESIIRRFGKPRGSSLTGWLPAAWLRHLGSRLLGSEWFARHVVIDHWFLHSRQGPLPPEDEPAPRAPATLA